MQQPNPLMIMLKEVWPTVYRIVNTVLYFFFHLFKVVVSRSISQIRGK